jgi:hypothetical protein
MTMRDPQAYSGGDMEIKINLTSEQILIPEIFVECTLMVKTRKQL